MWGETGLHQFVAQIRHHMPVVQRMPGARASGEVHPPGAAERDEGLTAPIVPALDRDDTDAAHHIGGGDAAPGGDRGRAHA